jgi:preprotein translocase subunit SecA
MINSILTKIFGDPSEKKVKFYQKEIEKIKEVEQKFENFSLEDVKNKTQEFKKKFENLDFRKKEDSEKIKNILNEIKYEAFALVKTTCKLINGQNFELSEGKNLTWNMIPYDVQLV